VIPGALGTLVRKEFAELRRDRRVLLLTLVLPVVLYPVVIGAMNRVQEDHAEEVETAEYPVAVAGDHGELTSVLAGVEGIRWKRVEPDSLRAMLDARLAVLAVRLPDADAAVDTVRLIGRMTNSSAQVVSDRIEAALESARWEFLEREYSARGGEGGLDAPLALHTRDVSTARESGGAEAGRLLVYLLLMTLFMAASTLGIDMIAGEKERGTLETLFLTPLDRTLVARAKLVVAGGGALLTGLLSLLSLSLSYGTGWLTPDGTASALDPAAIALVAALMLPLAVLLAAVMLVVSAWARSLKEAQYYVLPVMLTVFVPAFLSMSQAIEATGLVTVLPIANVAFVMRDVLAGRPDATTMVIVVASTILWIVLAARRVTALMEREETVLGFDPEPFFAATEGGRRRAIQVALALTVVGFFYVGQWLQSRAPLWGLALSLWVLLPVLALLTQRLVRGPRPPWTEAVALRVPSAAHLLGALCLGLGMILPVIGLQQLQAQFLPAPASQFELLGQTFERMAVWQLFLLAAVSPAVCEEFVFRGVFLGHLRRQGSDRRAILWSAFWFALVHLSVFRFLPTFLLGLVLAGAVVRTRSIVPAVVLHLTYNGSLLLGERWLRTHEPPFALDGPVAAAVAAGLLFAGSALLVRWPRLRPAPAELP
jgi:sodium transport system permease protein